MGYMEKMVAFWEAYDAALAALIIMSKIWEDAECATNIEGAMTEEGYPKYLPSFDEFVHDFIGIWPRR